MLAPLTHVLYPCGYYNVGLAHGIPGIICVLANFLSAGEDATRVKALLTGTVNWLRAQDQHVPNPSGFA